jgi:hypothetical protein
MHGCVLGRTEPVSIGDAAAGGRGAVESASAPGGDAPPITAEPTTDQNPTRCQKHTPATNPPPHQSIGTRARAIGLVSSCRPP